jgi:2-iminobutanoate/2-iminopropanoate deaminase
VLAEAGSGPEHVLRVECWLANASDFAEWNARYAALFPPPRPARTTLVLPEFPVPGLLIEVQMTAGVAT